MNIQPRDANIVTCMWFEIPVKHWNDALSTSFIQYQTTSEGCPIHPNCDGSWKVPKDREFCDRSWIFFTWQTVRVRWSSSVADRDGPSSIDKVKDDRCQVMRDLEQSLLVLREGDKMLTDGERSWRTVTNWYGQRRSVSGRERLRIVCTWGGGRV